MKKTFAGRNRHRRERYYKKLLSDTAYHITLFARHAGEQYSEDSRTAVINGDAENMEDLKKAVQGQDVVYCAISGDALPKIAGNIVAAMSESSVKRLIFMGGGRNLQ